MVFRDDSFVKVSGIVLPGLVKSIEIKDDARVEEQEVEGNSKKAKQAEGYEDAKITIELILLDSEEQTKEEKLEVIQGLFKKSGQLKPEIHELVNEHTAIRKISKVILKSFSSKYESKRDQITAALEFWSYEPMVITAVKSSGQKSRTTSNNHAASTGASVSASRNLNLSADYQSYLLSHRGAAPRTSKSPAIDNAPLLMGLEQ